jgi:sugar phosphate isomerase/epimerase
LSNLGYDGIELAGEPSTYRASEVGSVLDRHGLVLTSICGIYTPARDISHPDPSTRAAGVRYITGCAELARALGASVVIVVPTAVGRVAPVATPGEEWSWAVESLRAAADGAAQHDVRLVIESLNRYETYLVNTLSVAARMAREVDRPNVGLMADLFHMNIEEPNIAATIRDAGDLVWHVHLADSNRRPPGLGHTDFAAAISALKDTGYQGSLTMEFLPSTSNPYEAASLDVPEDAKMEDARLAISHMRDLV